MKRICAWHKGNFGFELVREEGNAPVTHGICPDCATIEEAKLNALRLESNAQFGEPYIAGCVPLNLRPGADVWQRRALIR